MSDGGNDAKSWAEFLDRIREARHDLGNPSVIWYRGQAKAGHGLMPSLLRHPKGIEKERILFDAYERFAAYLAEEKKSDWDLLNDMQHYGIPTRLLDWTDVLGIAIAFALYDSADDDIDSAIFVLAPLALNDLSKVKGVKRARNEPNFDYKNVYWEGDPFSPSFPIAIDSTLHNKRLRAQSGSFTVHGHDRRALEVQTRDVVRKVVLATGVKPEAREFLEHANLNPFSLYPDEVGMARYLVRRYLGP